MLFRSRTTTANISNTPFLSQFMVYRPQVLAVSIDYQAFSGSDIDHIREARRLQLLKINVSDSLDYVMCPFDLIAYRALNEPPYQARDYSTGARRSCFVRKKMGRHARDQFTGSERCTWLKRVPVITPPP